MDRIDIRAGGEIYVFELQDIEFGYFGIRQAINSLNQPVSFGIGGGTIGSVYDRINFYGSGIYSIKSMGDLTLATQLNVIGSGDLILSARSIQMTELARLSTNTGSLNVLAESSLILSQVSSASGRIRLESQTSFIHKLGGLELINVISVEPVLVSALLSVDFSVDANEVTLNGNSILRGEGEPFITLFLIFNS